MAVNEEQKLSIEESFQRLDAILAALELEDTPLEDSFRLYEEGMRLVKSCGASIERVEKKLRLISGEDAPEEGGDLYEG